ncbi:prephenate dehydrogenase [Candidatus Micrarchaeota archaeon]|nr:prephenate dehydrogenase [Candidatus Micrarchaeota archaeon]
MRIAVVGIGNMGSWIAKELAKDGNSVAVYDTNPSRTERIVGADIRALGSISELGDFSPELLVNAVNIEKTTEVFSGFLGFLAPGCMIADVASVKGELPSYYESCGFSFVSVHPMFGPTFANVEDLRKENAVIISESCDEGKEFFRSFFSSLGLNVFEYSFLEHERMMAYSLALPFVSSMVFAACMDKTAVPGTTFAKHKAIAKGLFSEDDHLLAEVIFNPEALSQVEKVTGRLEYLKHIIRDKDFKEAQRFFSKLRENME